MRFDVLLAAAIAAAATTMPAIARDTSPTLTKAAFEAAKEAVTSAAEAERPKPDSAKETKLAMLSVSDPLARERFGGTMPPRNKIDKAAVASVGRGQGFSDIVSRYAKAYGIPVALAHAVIRVESNYQVNARGSAGEIGLMQIKPSTARLMGYTGSARGLYNPETNIKYGMKYLALAYKLGGGTICGTALRYNAGHAAKRMNGISAAYCAKIKRHLTD